MTPELEKLELCIGNKVMWATLDVHVCHVCILCYLHKFCLVKAPIFSPNWFSWVGQKCMTMSPKDMLQVWLKTVQEQKSFREKTVL